MSEVKCPYCGREQEINHDDGYDEDCEHEQACINCDKDFKYTTSITYSYSVLCQDGDHDMRPFGGNWPDIFVCKNCSFFEKRGMKRKITMKVYFTKESANNDPEDLTPGKRYEATDTIHYKTYSIVDDAGDVIHIDIKHCSHLYGGFWIVEDDDIL